jgi:hypothetical protein
VQRLERYGFAALYINRKGYEDRAEKLLAELETLGYRKRLQGSGEQQVIVFLRPTEKPELPLGRSLTFGSGWHPRPEDGVRWAMEEAAISYFNPYQRGLTASLKLDLVGVSKRNVVLEHNGRAVRSVAVGDQPVTMELADFELAPGMNCFALRSSEPAKRLSTGRYQLRAFGLKSSMIRVRAGGGIDDWSQ